MPHYLETLRLLCYVYARQISDRSLIAFMVSLNFMRVDLRKIGSAGGQGDRGADRGEAAMASRLAFGSLEQSVQGFEKTVGRPRLRSGNSALEARAYPKGGLLHGFSSGAPDVGVPSGEHRAHGGRLPAVQDLAQLLGLPPCRCRAPGGHVSPMGESISAPTSSPRRMSRTGCVLSMPDTAGRPSATKSMRIASVLVAASSPIPATHRGAAIPEAVRDILSVMTARSITTAVLLYGYPHGFQQRRYYG